MIWSFVNVTSGIRFQFCALDDLVSGLCIVICLSLCYPVCYCCARWILGFMKYLPVLYFLLKREPISIYGTVFRKKKFYESLRCKPKLLRLRIICLSCRCLSILGFGISFMSVGKKYLYIGSGVSCFAHSLTYPYAWLWLGPSSWNMLESCLN